MTYVTIEPLKRNIGMVGMKQSKCSITIADDCLPRYFQIHQTSLTTTTSTKEFYKSNLIDGRFEISFLEMTNIPIFPSNQMTKPTL